MKSTIEKLIKENQSAIAGLLKEDKISLLEKIAEAMNTSLASGGKVIVFGNGGSAADSQHMAAELVGRFKKERKALPAISLTTNTSTISALSNDYGYDISFKRQLEALGKKGDTCLGISTSGNAKNVIEALKTAKANGIKTIALTGKEGGEVKSIADLVFVVDSNDTPRIQEAHILLIHILCEIIENEQSKAS